MYFLVVVGVCKVCRRRWSLWRESVRDLDRLGSGRGWAEGRLRGVDVAAWRIRVSEVCRPRSRRVLWGDATNEVAMEVFE